MKKCLKCLKFEMPKVMAAFGEIICQNYVIQSMYVAGIRRIYLES